jgi:hypothetical protein
MKIDATTILLIGAAGIAIYLITRPRTVPTTLPVYNPVPGYNPYTTAANPTAQDISAGSQGISSIISALGQSGLFSGGSAGSSAASSGAGNMYV